MNSVGGLFDLGCVRRAIEALERHSGVEGHIKPDPIDRTLIRVEDRRSHPGRIFDLIRFEGPAGAGFCLGRYRRTGYVARAHHHREAELEAAGVIFEDLLVRDAHRHLFAGPNVGDRGCEDIRPLLFDQ